MAVFIGNGHSPFFGGLAPQLPSSQHDPTNPDDFIRLASARQRGGIFSVRSTHLHPQRGVSADRADADVRARLPDRSAGAGDRTRSGDRIRLLAQAPSLRSGMEDRLSATAVRSAVNVPVRRCRENTHDQKKVSR